MYLTKEGALKGLVTLPNNHISTGDIILSQDSTAYILHSIWISYPEPIGKYFR